MNIRLLRESSEAEIVAIFLKTGIILRSIGGGTKVGVKQHVHDIQNPDASGFYCGAGKMIADRVKIIVAEELNVDIAKLSPSTHFYHDLGCSLDVVEVILGCETEFGIELPDEDVDGMGTIEDLTRIIEKRLGRCQ